ncbi:unnamed protein product [Linum trigynum]|uniref:Uncharacterized protein n=1 Tax=Linum trigynum TaxID=586398 RepID=A0AAV2DPB1_9ROSI
MFGGRIYMGEGARGISEILDEGGRNQRKVKAHRKRLTGCCRVVCRPNSSVRPRHRRRSSGRRRGRRGGRISRRRGRLLRQGVRPGGRRTIGGRDRNLTRGRHGNLRRTRRNLRARKQLGV